MVTRLEGAQFAVEFVERGDGKGHICIQLQGEDDDHWFDIGTSFSSYWLPDLIDVLQQAQAVLEKNASKDPSGYAFKR